jgi:hypothetical protein
VLKRRSGELAEGVNAHEVRTVVMWKPPEQKPEPEQKLKQEPKQEPDQEPEQKPEQKPDPEPESDQLNSDYVEALITGLGKGCGSLIGFTRSKNNE